jgi:methyl-accepting chemotaxis protein
MGRDQQFSLASLRLAGTGVIVVSAWLMTAGLLGNALIAGGPDAWPVAIIALVCAIVPTWLWRSGDTGTIARIVLGCTVPIYPAAVLALMKGHLWQLDMHMMFFAGVAMLVVLCDWRAILAATLVTAVHHLGFNYFATAYVFNTDGSFARVLMHAVILLIEAGVLMWVSMRLSMLFTAVGDEHARATAALANSEAAEAEARRLQSAQADVVSALRSGLSELSELRLTHRIETAFAPEYEQLRFDFNSALDALQSTIGTFARGTASIYEASAQVVEASQDLARRTEQQASSLQQTAQQTNDIANMVETAAKSAASTDAIFRAVFGEAQTGGGVVRDARAAMDKIEDSSQSIGSIVSLIEGIAFQTNLLALNAGVEAARAGAAGQGFAVVAHEVRTLAGRASEAAAQIKSLIDSSTTHVGEGVNLVGRAGTTLDSVVNKLEEVRGLLAGAAEMSRQQAEGLREVRTVISDLDRGTQQNAAMAEQSTAATRSMTNDLQTLKNELARFKVS